MNVLSLILPPQADCDCGAGNDQRLPHDLCCPWSPLVLYLRRRAFEEAEIVGAAR